MDGESNAELKLGPQWLYPAKALVTHARSAVFLYGRPAHRHPGGVRILFYHRVADERDELAVAPRAFAAQMDELARRGVRGVAVGDLVSLLAEGAELPVDVVGISFDDGYADVAEHAVPVLERHGFGATVFIATEVTRGRAPLTWYREQPRLIGWDELPDLDRSTPLRFEAHTRTHPNLLGLHDVEAAREIGESRQELATQLGRPVEGFCYPAGLFGARERDLVAAAGYSWATSCEPGVNDVSTDRYALRRIQIDARDASFDFRAKLLGGHDRPLPVRALYRRLRYRAPAASTRS